MRLHRILLALAGLVIALSAAPRTAPAQSIKVPTLIVQNGTNYPVHVTIYSATIFDKRDIVCSGRANVGGAYQCTFMHMHSFPRYFARGELMNAAGRTICDTHGQMYGSSVEKISVIKYNGKGCWVERGRM